MPAHRVALVRADDRFEAYSASLPYARALTTALDDLTGRGRGRRVGLGSSLGGLALLVTSRFKNGAVRVLTWALVVVLVAFVALSRMYRGMHHPLDVGGGLLVGVAALAVLVFACRLGGAVYDKRRQGGEA